jgi:hypothetical protein
MNAPFLRDEPPEVAIKRLAGLKASPDCVVYCAGAQFGAKGGLRLSIYGAWPTREIFLEVTDGEHTRVNSFESRFEHFPPDQRRAELPLIDMSDAFNLARTMLGKWPSHG